MRNAIWRVDWCRQNRSEAVGSMVNESKALLSAVDNSASSAESRLRKPKRHIEGLDFLLRCESWTGGHIDCASAMGEYSRLLRLII